MNYNARTVRIDPQVCDSHVHFEDNEVITVLILKVACGLDSTKLNDITNCIIIDNRTKPSRLNLDPVRGRAFALLPVKKIIKIRLHSCILSSIKIIQIVFLAR